MQSNSNALQLPPTADIEKCHRDTLQFTMDFLTRWLPLFTDISTDVDSPPVLHPVIEDGVDRERILEYPSEKGELQSFVYGDLIPLQANLTRETLFEIALQLAKERARWRIVYQDPRTYRVQAISTTRLCNFSDDVAIEIRSDRKQRGAQLHMRSRSRFGVTDFGTNARRIRAFINDMTQALKMVR